jgi:hypothetical protein
MRYKSVLLSLMLAYSATAGAQSFSSKFDSKNHVKAKGVWLGGGLFGLSVSLCGLKSKIR